jgi:hypothetical protein
VKKKKIKALAFFYFRQVDEAHSFAVTVHVSVAMDKFTLELIFRGTKQGDQTGLIFAHWAFFTLSTFLKITEVAQILGL